MSKSTPNTSGQSGRAIYVDSVHEALDKARRAKPVGQGDTPRRPRRQLVDVGTRQLRECEKLQRVLKKQLATMSDAGVMPDEKFIFAFNGLTTSITKTMEQIRRSRKAELDALGSLNADQLDDVMRLHLVRLAGKMLPDDRHAMLVCWFGVDVAAVLMAGPQVESPDAPTAEVLS